MKLCLCAFSAVLLFVGPVRGQNLDNTFSFVAQPDEPRELEVILRQQLKACWDQSDTFKRLLFDVASAGVRVPLRVNSGMGWPVGTLERGTVLVGLADLETVPDPSTAAGAGTQISAEIPQWATTRCAFLGHEIREQLAINVMGERYNQGAHYDSLHAIAIAVEDSIVNDVFTTGRARGDHCFVGHRSHQDVVIEVKGLGYEVYHRADSIPNWDLKDGGLQTSPWWPSHRLAYVDYFTGTFPPDTLPQGATCTPRR